jgi:hypothetical protein
MWQICGHVPQSLLVLSDITFRAAQLSVSFFIETFIHAKEKVNKRVQYYNGSFYQNLADHEILTRYCEGYYCYLSKFLSKKVSIFIG